MLEGFLKGLEQPEYIHVLINPLPVYGLAMGLIGLMIGLVLRSREARIGAFALILIAAASAWPTLHYGKQGYDRVKGMADSEAQNGSTNTSTAASSSFMSSTLWARSRWYQPPWNGSGRKPRCRWRLRHWRWPRTRSASAATLPTWADTSGTKSSASSKRPNSARSIRRDPDNWAR